MPVLAGLLGRVPQEPHPARDGRRTRIELPLFGIPEVLLARASGRRANRRRHPEPRRLAAPEKVTTRSTVVSKPREIAMKGKIYRVYVKLAAVAGAAIAGGGLLTAHAQ